MNKIEAKNVNVFYGEKQALFDINMDIQEKQVTALIGPSGCGKSTLVNLVAGVDHPDTGEIKINGNTIMNTLNLMKLLIE